MKTALASFVVAAAVLGAAGETVAQSSAPGAGASTPPPATSSIPASSMSPTPVAPPSSPPGSPPPSPRRTNAAVRMHCAGIGDGTFATVNVETRSATVPIPPGVAPVALAPLPSFGGAGTLLLRDGELDASYTGWLASGPQARAQACELDVTVASTTPHNRYAIVGVVPVSIVSVADGGASSGVTLELRYTEIDLLGF